MGTAGVRRQVGLVLEAVAHRRGRQVELVHRRQAEDQLDRLDHARLVVVGVIDELAPRVRADDQRHGAVAVDVVEAVLRIVLDDEDAGVLPELALADRLDDLPQRQVVVGHHGPRRRRARAACRWCGRTAGTGRPGSGTRPSARTPSTPRGTASPGTRRASS